MQVMSMKPEQTHTQLSRNIYTLYINHPTKTSLDLIKDIRAQQQVLGIFTFPAFTTSMIKKKLLF